MFMQAEVVKSVGHKILYMQVGGSLSWEKGSIGRYKGMRKGYGGRCQHNTLYTCVKLSKNKLGVLLLFSFSFKKIAGRGWPRKVDNYYYQTDRL